MYHRAYIAAGMGLRQRAPSWTAYAFSVRSSTHMRSTSLKSRHHSLALHFTHTHTLSLDTHTHSPYSSVLKIVSIDGFGAAALAAGAAAGSALTGVPVGGAAMM